MPRQPAGRGLELGPRGFGLSRPASQPPPIRGQRRGLAGRGGKGGVLLRMRTGETVFPWRPPDSAGSELGGWPRPSSSPSSPLQRCPR